MIISFIYNILFQPAEIEKPKEEVQTQVKEEEQVEISQTEEITTVEIEKPLEEKKQEVTTIEEQVSFPIKYRATFSALFLAYGNH